MRQCIATALPLDGNLVASHAQLPTVSGDVGNSLGSL